MIVLRLPFVILLYLLGTLRETLPDTTDEAGYFLSGFTWAFVLHWVFLILVTLVWAATR